ncbi:MAG: methylated-DNA--[protein]-cysteine S-methyltransferase [Moraxellaceae bacterium]|jgi:AraC family transcriptional regulator of adaptative response/methylated-DNA-[protein]-cysteine methyltransferase|nr:methylated-DNA--[protein]-cysteine S-methyltransferase [Moraxellaceae bacterium]
MTIPDVDNAGLPDRTTAFALVAQAAAQLAHVDAEAPSLAALAAGAGLSPSRFQRLFSQWMGVSPKRYRQHLVGCRARAALLDGADLLSVTAEAGLSGPGRLHDLMVVVAAATPGEVKRGGAGLAVTWGVAETPLGPAFFASSARGLMKLSFLDPAGSGTGGAAAAAHAPGTDTGTGIAACTDTDALALAIAELYHDWPAATLARDDVAAGALAHRLFSAWRGPEPVHLFVKGSQFQLRVWEALLRIPEGELATYGTLAAALGQPGASRAVGGAVGANPVALLIPCHRVIRATGETGGYRWGEARKRVLLAAELAWQEAASVDGVTK